EAGVVLEHERRRRAILASLRMHIFAAAAVGRSAAENRPLRRVELEISADVARNRDGGEHTRCDHGEHAGANPPSTTPPLLEPTRVRGGDVLPDCLEIDHGVTPLSRREREPSPRATRMRAATSEQPRDPA